MKNINLSSKTVELNKKKRELNSALANLKNNLTNESGNSRKNRYFFRRYKEISEEIAETDRRIEEEKTIFTNSRMFHTPPRFSDQASNVPLPVEEGDKETNTLDTAATGLNVDAKPVENPSAYTAPQNPQIPTETTQTSAANLLPSYEELKRREMEEKIEKLQKDLKKSQEFTQSLLQNNVLIPQKRQKRVVEFEDFELKKPERMPKQMAPKGVAQLGPNTSRLSGINAQATQPTIQIDAQTNVPPNTPIYINLTDQENEIQESVTPQNQNTIISPVHNQDLQNEPHQFMQQTERIFEPYTPQNENANQSQIQTPFRIRMRNTYNETPQQNQEQLPIQNETNNPDRGPQSNVPNETRQQNSERARHSYLRRLKTIPAFSGNSYTELREFFDVVDILHSSIQNDTEEVEFYDQLLLQIRGEAKNAIESLSNSDWQTIKEKLQTYFSHMANKDIVNSKLENLKQEKNETLSEYIERARKLLQEKNLIYNRLSEEQRNEHNKIARRAFARGLKDQKLRERLQIHGASSFEAAIAYSIETENYMASQITDRETFCVYCRRTGHKQRTCFQRNQNTNEITSLVSALRSVNIHSNGTRRTVTNSTFPLRDRNNTWNRNFNANPNFWVNRDNRNFNRNYNNNNNSRIWNGNGIRNWMSNGNRNWNNGQNWNARGNNNWNANRD